MNKHISPSPSYEKFKLSGFTTTLHQIEKAKNQTQINMPFLSQIVKKVNSNNDLKEDSNRTFSGMIVRAF